MCYSHLVSRVQRCHSISYNPHDSPHNNKDWPSSKCYYVPRLRNPALHNTVNISSNKYSLPSYWNANETSFNMNKLYAKLKKNKRLLTGNETTNEMILWVHRDERSSTRESEPWPTNLLKRKLDCSLNLIVGVEFTFRHMESPFN